MADNKINLEIAASVKDAQKSLQDLNTTANKAFDSIGKSADNAFKQLAQSNKTVSDSFLSTANLIKGAFVAAAAFIGGKALIGAFEDAIEAASKEQDAINQLNTALALTGKYTEETSKDLVDFAESLELTTKFGNEAVLSAQALIQNLGRLSGEGLKTATQAAVDLSAALGIDLDSAARLVGKAAEGNVSAFKKFGISVQEGTTKAETFANALKQLQDRFGGAAAAQLNTFSGATTQLGNSVDDAQKSVGRLIVDNPAVIAGVQILTKTIRALTEAFDRNKQPIADAIGNLVKLSAGAIPGVISAMSGFIKLMSLGAQAVNFLGIGVIEAVSSLTKLGEYLGIASGESVQSFTNSLTNVQVGLAKTNEEIDSFSTSITDSIDAAVPDVAKLVGSFDKLTAGIKTTTPAVKAVGAAIDDELDTARVEAFKGSFDKVKNSIEDITKEINKQTKSKRDQIDADFKASVQLAANAGKELALQGKLTKEAADQISKFVELQQIKRDLASSKITLGEFTFGDLKSKFKEVFSGDVIGNVTNALDAAATSFGEKFENLTLGDVGSGILDALSTGAEVLGGVLGGGYLQSLSNFVEEVGNIPSKFVEIATKFGDIITNLLDSLPEVAATIADQLPAILDKIIQTFPKLVEQLLPIFSKLVDVISEKAPEFAGIILDAITKLVDAAPAFIDKTVKALPKVLTVILQKLPALITAIAQAIGPIIRTLAEAIPVLVQVIADNIAPIILALVQGILEAIPDIILTLIDVFIVKGGIFKIVGALIAAMPEIAIALVQGIIRAAFNSTGQLAEYLGSLLGTAFSSSIKLPSFDLGETKDFLSGKLLVEKIRENFATIKDILTGKLFAEKVKALFDKFQEQLKTILSGGLSGGKGGAAAGALSKVGIKLAEGGIVPKPLYAANGAFVPRGTDTVPAMLTPGELVIPRGEVDRLSAFLDDQARNNSKPSTDSTLLARFDALVAKLDRSTEKDLTVKISLGEKDLADVLLNLNRQGFRVA